MKNNKGWIMFGIFVIAAILAFAIYKVSGTTNTTVTTSGGSVTESDGGIGSLIGSIFGLNLGGLFGGGSTIPKPTVTGLS